MSTYAVNDGEIMSYHWATNVFSASLGSYELVLYERGSTQIYSANLSSLISSVYENSDFYDSKAADRYMLFTPERKAGQIDYDGLVYDLNEGGDSGNFGFIDGYIEAVGGSAITTALSANWYVAQDSDVLGATFAQSAGTGTLSLVIPDGSHILTDLPSAKFQVVGSSGLAVSSPVTVGLTENSAKLAVTYTSSSSGMVARLTLSGSGSFDYVRDFDFGRSTVPGGVNPGRLDGGKLGESINGMMASIGGDNDLGHYLAILIGVLLCVVLSLFQSSNFGKMMCLVGGLLVLGAGIVLGWVDAWLIILLALGAGIMVWRVMKRGEV